ncbi:MAG: AAA family ATPase [Acetobacteraceae bacterium]
MKTIGFFNNKGGVGKTSLVYHVAWMLAEIGIRVVTIDLDPQANLTSMFLSEERLEELWAVPTPPTIYGAVSLQFRGVSDVQPPHIEPISDNIGLVVGDLALSGIEDDLSAAWPKCQTRDERSFRVMSAFARTIATAGALHGAEIALVDVGPNLGALNRAALLACDVVAVPLGADLFSLQGLRNMGPTLREWRTVWNEVRPKNPDPTLTLPAGTMRPIGYVVMRHSVTAGRPARAYGKWIGRMPEQYRLYVLNSPAAQPSDIAEDPNCLAQLKDYRSLMPLAQEAHKPMFLLRPGDGAFGGHQMAVTRCYDDFEALTKRILTQSAP